jgi:hypothetical protein
VKLKTVFLLASVCAAANAQSWYNSSWTYRKILAVDHRRVLGNLTNYPAYVAFNQDADLAGHLRSDCHDFLVTLTDGTKLDYELRKCDAVGGSVGAVVRIPTLSATVDTTLVVYYGNSSATDQSNPTGVWSASYKIVLPGGSLTDSTGNHNNATVNGTAPQSVAGIYANAYRFNGISSYLTTATAPVSTAYTLSFWFKADALGNNAVVFAPIVGALGAVNASYGPFGMCYDTFEPWEGMFYQGYSTAAHPGQSGFPIVEAGDQKVAPNKWYLATETWDGATTTAYLDGRLLGTGASSTLTALVGGLFIGGDAGHSIRVSVGEVRLLNTAIATAEVATEAVNYWNPDTFFNVGIAETNVTAVPVIHAFTATYAGIESGKPSYLHWLVSNATSIGIDNGIGSQTTLNSGWTTVNPTSSTTYTITATNGSGSSTQTVTVSVLTGTVAYPRYGKPGGTWVRGYTADGSGHAVMQTWEPHRYVPGDYILQYGECSSDSTVNYASNLNGKFIVATVLDGGQYTLNTMAGVAVTPNAAGTWCNGASGNAAIWTGRAVPISMPAGPKGILDGKDGPITHRLWTSTDNGMVSLTADGTTATITFSYTHDAKVGQTVAIFNTTSSTINGEHTITAVTGTTIQFLTSASGTFTGNNVCGPSSGNPNVIGGTANCVTVSLYAYAANPLWAKILSDTAFPGGPNDYKSTFDGGTTYRAADALGFQFVEAAWRLGIDRTNQAMLDALVYYVSHVQRTNGVNWDAVAFSDEGGSGSQGLGHLWQFDFYADSLPYALTSYLGHLTTGQKSYYNDSMWNGVTDPAHQCNQVHPTREVLATGTAQNGGSGTTIVLAAGDPASTDGFYINNIINFSDGSHIFWGLVTAYNHTTKTATVGTITRTSSYTSQDETTVGSWTTPTSSSVYEIDATATINGTTLTGYNTNWTTSTAAGDAIVAYFSWPASSSPFNEYYISSRTDTSATVIAAPQANGSSTPRPVWIIPAFNQGRGDCGLLWRLSWSSGGMGPQPIQFPGAAGNSVSSTWKYMPGLNDEGGSQEVPAMSYGAASADDDPRAIDTWQQAQSMDMDYDLRFMLGTNGLTENGTHYGESVEQTNGCLATLMLHNSLPASMMTGLESSSFVGGINAGKQYMTMPDLAGGLLHRYVYGANSGASTIMVEAGAIEHDSIAIDCASIFNPGGSQAQYLRDFLHTMSLDGGPTGYAVELFPLVDPRIPNSGSGGVSYTAQPLQYLISPATSGSALCKAVSGADLSSPLTCDAQKGDAAISRTSWTDRSATEVMVEARSCCSCCYDAPSGGLLKAYKVGHLLTDDFQIPGNTDYAGVPDQTEHAEMPRFNETNTIRNSSTPYGVAKTFMSRWASRGGSFGPEYGDESSTFMYAQADLTGAYSTTYNYVHRDFVHFKKPGAEEILIQFDSIDASNATPASGIRFGVHYAQNGESGNATNGLGPEYNEGQTTCPGSGGCSSLNSNRAILSEEDGSAADANGPARTAAIVTTWFSPGTITLRDEGAGYPNGNGHTHKVDVCAGSSCGSSTSTLEAVTVHKIVPNFNVDTTLTATALNPDANWTGVQTTDKVALFARGGVTHSTITGFTTTHSGTAQYLFAGLTPETYTVKVNNVAVPGSPFTVAANDNSIEFENTAGTVSILGSGGIPVLALSPGSLSYSCVSGGANPAAQSIGVSASNVTLDNWSAANTMSWLTLSPAAGSAAGSFTASVNCAGQPVGAQTDTITVSSTTTGITNSPQTVAVSLTVSAPLGVGSAISGKAAASGNVTVH